MSGQRKSCKYNFASKVKVIEQNDNFELDETPGWTVV